MRTGPLRELGERLADRRVERMARDDRVEAVAPRRARDRPRDEPYEVEPRVRERLDRMVERTRPVAR